MAEDTSKRVHTLPPAEAARWLGIDEGAVRALVQARYLSVFEDEIPMAEVRAFQARNAEAGAGPVFEDYKQSADFEELIAALSLRTDELAAQALELFLRATPQARQWGAPQREAFLAQATGRFDAILAVTSQGADVDAALQDDLREVGANAAWAGSSLPHLLLVLRISRDLLLQTSMQLSADGSGRWDAIVAGFMTELMPAIDRLTDAISSGYWRALVDQSREDLERLTFLIDNSPYGVYEADIDGIVQYANPAMAAMVGRPGESLVEMPLSEVFRPVKGSVHQLLAEHSEGVGQVNLLIPSESGDLELDVDTVVRRIDEDAIGFGGIARISNGAGKSDLTPLIRHIFELRRSVEILADAGAFMTDHSNALNSEQVHQAGENVQRQAERLMLILNELDDDRKALQPPGLS